MGNTPSITTGNNQIFVKKQMFTRLGIGLLPEIVCFVKIKSCFLPQIIYNIFGEPDSRPVIHTPPFKLAPLGSPTLVLYFSI